MSTAFKHVSLSLCAVLALVLGPVAGSVSAQSVDTDVTGSLEVRARIVPGLSMTLERGLDFGDVATGAGTVSIGRVSAQSGKCFIEGMGRGVATVQFIRPENGQLVRQSGPGALGLDLQVYGNDEDAAVNATRLEDGDAITMSNLGRYHFFVQGDLEVGLTEQNPTGIYTGSLTMVVTYQ